MQHQKEALDFLKQRQSAGLFFEMGLGKTLVMLEHLARLSLDMKRPFPCLIVCPLSVISVWQREVVKFSYPFKVSRVIGSYQERLRALSVEADIYIINYEGLRVIPEQLKKKGFRTLILDESHRIKERKSRQTEVALQLGSLVENRFLLTGTPVTKSPEDIWAQLHWLNPTSAGNFFSFRSRYIDFKKIRVRSAGGMREISKAYRFKNLFELEDKIAENCLRRTKKECLDLPEKIYKTIYCDMSEAQSKHYYDLKSSLATLVESETLNVKTAATLVQKLQQVCQGFLYDDERNPKWFKDSGKLSMLKDVLEDLQDEKIILFTWFKADVARLYEELSKTHKVILYDGTPDQRAAIEKEFQESVGGCIFLSQIEKAKEGITLTAASHVIYYGNSWSHGTRVQSEDRAHRKGQTKSVIYYDFIVPNTVDELVYYTLKEKADVADKVTGDSLRLAKLLLQQSITD